VSKDVAPAAAWYVYGVVPAGAAGQSEGVAGRPVEVVDGVEVAALVSPVSLEEFAEEPLRENLNDRAWLEQTARAHEAVLERALDAFPVVPFRLCTIYGSREQVRRLVAERAPRLGELLRRLEGRVELGVKAYFDETRFAGAAEPPSEGAAPGSGREYLLRRQRERALAEEAARFKAECARSSHERLAAAAEEARANPPQAPELSGRAEEMVLNGAYLVRRDDAGLAEALAELEGLYGERGVSYELTGPWPAYNFVPREIMEA
jgi:hypothetical protein